nr:NRPS [Corallococcus coralloides]
MAMSVSEFVESLRSQGFTLAVEAGMLKVNAPRGGMSAELRARIAQLKPELVAFLSSPAAPRPPPAPREEVSPVQAPELVTAAPAPRKANAVVERLRELAAAVFRLPSVAANASFYELGGDSARAMLLCARINEAFGVELAVRAIFEHPTIEQLAQHISQRMPGSDSARPLGR